MPNSCRLCSWGGGIDNPTYLFPFFGVRDLAFCFVMPGMHFYQVHALVVDMHLDSGGGEHDFIGLSMTVGWRILLRCLFFCLTVVDFLVRAAKATDF